MENAGGKMLKGTSKAAKALGPLFFLDMGVALAENMYEGGVYGNIRDNESKELTRMSEELKRLNELDAEIQEQYTENLLKRSENRQIRDDLKHIDKIDHLQTEIARTVLQQSDNTGDSKRFLKIFLLVLLVISLIRILKT